MITLRRSARTCTSQSASNISSPPLRTDGTFRTATRACSTLQNGASGHVSCQAQLEEHPLLGNLPFATISPKLLALFDRHGEFVALAKKLRAIAKATTIAVRHRFKRRDSHLGGGSSTSHLSSAEALAAAEAVSRADRERERETRLAREMAVWFDNPQWIDQAPEIKVTSPPGNVSYLTCKFMVGLPPEAVFDILCDEDNHRVFKNVKETKGKSVLEEHGSYQRVIVEQTALWHFLCFSGTFDVCMEVSTDRFLRQIRYKLSQGGFMKRFEGQWEIEPFPVPAHYTLPTVFKEKSPVRNRSSRLSGAPSRSISPSPTPNSSFSPSPWSSSDPSSPSPTLPDSSSSSPSVYASPPPSLVPSTTTPSTAPGRMASLVTLNQQLQPAIPLPPFISNNVAGISANATRSMLSDLQAEARRVRERQPILASPLLAGRSNQSHHHGRGRGHHTQQTHRERRDGAKGPDNDAFEGKAGGENEGKGEARGQDNGRGGNRRSQRDSRFCAKLRRQRKFQEI
eukprot:TRINITY_DN35571_c0_g1_i1.p1 TRINITY_DN35571_c0_g1~~TRINITY_DN35571_c0_g1_i1.p1  ORF type:complete len:512 (+),score=89.62 TRINITY_DN35571_c0_g1_i1:1117-2652(+)